MKASIKKAISLLLAVVMVLGMLPVVALAAEETYIATAASGIPTDKDVAIYTPNDKYVWGSEVSDSIGAQSATPEGNTLVVSEGTGVYRLTKNDDGTYYITKAGKYLTATSTSAVNLRDSAGDDAKWRIEATEGGYHIINATVQYNGNDLYMEYYSSAFKFYRYKESSAPIYVMSFYELPAEADADGDGRVGGPIPQAGALPEAGSKVVIYNDYAQGVIGMPLDNGALDCVASTLEGNDLTVGNGGMIFDVSINAEGYYVFSSTYAGTTTYMCTSESGNDLFMSETENERTQWKIDEGQAGWRIMNKTAKFNGKNSQYLEFFAEAFKTYSYFASNPEYYAFNFYVVEDAMNIGYVLNPKMAINARNADMGVDYSFTMELDDLSEIMSVEMTASVDGGTPFVVEDTGIDGYKYTYAITGDKLTGSKLTLKGTATNEYNMTYSAEVTVDILNEPIIRSVTPAASENLGSNKQPEIIVEIANCGSEPAVEMTIDGTAVSPTVSESKITYKPTTALAEGRHVVSVVITREDGKSVAKEWSFIVGEGGMDLYYGQMHSHTSEYSDGAGTLEDAYEYAMNAPDVDYLIVTDHSNYFDTTATATTKSYYDLSSLTKSGSITKWEEAKLTAAEYDAMSEDFVAGYGYEMTWSGGPGHTNSFNTYGTISRNNADLNNKTGYSGMHLYNDMMVNANLGLDENGNAVAAGVQTKYIEDAPVVSQLNHPGTTFGNFDNFAGYNPSRDSVINLIEVGNGEGAIGGSSYWPSYSQYDLALAKGWHVAPTNNQDNHKGKWGDANTARNVIVTDDFTEAGLYKAMSERRVYATEDQNLRIYYYLNDAIMGSIIPIDEDETVEKVTVQASISDPDGEVLGKIEVIGENGVTKYSVNAIGASYELKVELDNTDAYYYIKVTQADGDIAVTAPVWVGEATPITAVAESEAKISIVNEPEVLYAELTNAAGFDYTISKIEFTDTFAGTETVLYTSTETQTVAAGKSLKTSFGYTFTEEGIHKISVVYSGTYRGKSFTVMANFELKVRDGVMRIGVDYGHDNYYLTGDYSGSAGNFIDFCADNGVVCEEIKAGEFTYETISQYNLIVLTVPYRRNTAKANTYNEEELEALRRYASEGKNLIVCSKSDRDNKYDNCADNSNAILDAIGAHTRVVNGIIVDNEMKANEAYRLYFSGIENFNTEHPFTKGAYTASNAFETIPGSSNQTGFQVYNGGPIEIMEGYEDVVEVLVRGYDTTWGSHYDGYFTGSSFVPEYDEADSGKVTVKMGDVNIMTYEKLAAGGWVVTSGVTFFSNYDIKNDQDYANRFILLNILNSLKEEEVITPISTVKKQEDGAGEFTVEGFVTSNASAYDQDTAFFDCIYIQDEEGNGLNIFPVAGNYCIGMEVRCHGGVTYYCGEVELNLSTDYNGSISIISDEINILDPVKVTCEEAMSDDAIGNLMTVEGLVVDLHYTEGVVDKIFVQDETGIACVFINGYINKVYSGLDSLGIGDVVRATGIGSRDVDESSEEAAIFARLRVRTRREIVILTEGCTEHSWDNGTVTKEPTCGTVGVRTYTCALCRATKLESIPATGEHTYENGICTGCGKEDESVVDPTEPSEEPTEGDIYELKNEIKDGDKVIIVYAAENQAMSSEIISNYYKGAIVVAPVDGKITNPDTTIIWTVAADGEGFNLINEAGEKLSIDGTFNSIPYDKDNDAWTLEAAETEGCVYVVNQNGKHLSWSSYGNFSAYDKDNSKTNEAYRAMQVYVLTVEGEDPTEPTEPTTEPTEPSEEPTEPSEEPTEPSEEPTEPSEEPTEPSEEPTEPSEEPTEPSEEPTEPSEEPTEPTEPTEPFVNPYTDVAEDAWYYDYVKAATEKGLVNGIKADLFKPEANITRAQFATILYRALGAPSAEGIENPFTDLDPNQAWYTDAILYLSSKGIVNGVGKGRFAPESNITREQMVTMLYRAANVTASETYEALDKFEDKDAISGYAVDAMNWAISEGIVNGISSTKLAPQNLATRAQATKIILLFTELSK